MVEDDDMYMYMTCEFFTFLSITVDHVAAG